MKANITLARHEALSLYLCQRLYTLRVDVTGLRYDRPIFFDSLQNFCSKTKASLPQMLKNPDLQDGITLRGQRQSLVLYNENQPNLRRRAFTLAHEVGHIYLEHNSDSPENEQEANAFAAELLAPLAIVRELSRRLPSLGPEDLTSVFFLSHKAAQNRLRELHRPPCPLLRDLERQVEQRFACLLPALAGEPEISF